MHGQHMLNQASEKYFSQILAAPAASASTATGGGFFGMVRRALGGSTTDAPHDEPPRPTPPK